MFLSEIITISSRISLPINVVPVPVFHTPKTWIVPRHKATVGKQEAWILQPVEAPKSFEIEFLRLSLLIVRNTKAKSEFP